MKTEKSEKSETNQTKPVSFRIPMDIYEVLNDKGQEKDLSVGEVASEIVQENCQAPNEAIPVNDTVTCSKQVFLQQSSKQVIPLNRKEFKSLCYAITGSDYLPSYFDTIRIGKDKVRNVTKIGEDLWQVVVETSNVYNSNAR